MLVARVTQLILISNITLTTVAGCFKTSIVAPADEGVYYLANSYQKPVTKVKTRVWYLFWGLLPVSNNSSSEVIRRLPEGYRIVKINTSLDAGSLFVALLTAGIVGSTVITAEAVALPLKPGQEVIQPVHSTLPP